MNSKETQISNRINLFLLTFAVVWSPDQRHLIGFCFIEISSAKFYEDGIDCFGMRKHYSAIEF